MNNTKQKCFKRGLLACIFLSAPVAHAEEWAGTYIGGSVGYGRADMKTESIGTPGSSVAFGGAGDAKVALAQSLTRTYSGNRDRTAVSARIGYNWQKAQQVYGVEAELQGAPMRSESYLQKITPVPNWPSTTLPVDFRQKSSMEQMVTLRGRMGVVHGDWLFFGSAGLAVARVKTQVNYSGKFVPSFNLDPLNQSSESSNTRVGIIAGAGFDYALSKNWSLRTEYSYFDLGKSTQNYKVASNITAGGGFADATAHARTKWTGSLLMVGLNYRF